MAEGGSSGSMGIILLIGGVGCCCLVSIVVPVILYLTNQQFKDWVNGLFGKKDDDEGGDDDGTAENPAGTAGECKFDPATKKGADLPGYDPTACAGKCLYIGKPSTARVAKEGLWTKAGSTECTDWLISPRAGKFVCPYGYNYKENAPKTEKVTWCVQPGKDNIPAYQLPADARVGQFYKVTGRALYEQYMKKNINLGKPFTDKFWFTNIEYRASEDNKPYKVYKPA